jgi:protein-S-isoprenylcysteine O-methyltransferase Ste14
MKSNVLTLAAILGAMVWLGLHAGSVAWTPVKLAGAIVAGVSLVLLVAARLQLGASFSVQAKAKRLVTTGLYAKIRNPIYVFSALGILGMAAVLNSWLLAAFALVLLPVQLARARREESVLAEAFGEEYERYKAGTWF